MTFSGFLFGSPADYLDFRRIFFFSQFSNDLFLFPSSIFPQITLINAEFFLFQFYNDLFLFPFSIFP